ncbi:unnamed protein product [Angiostrongylus costaricensis]|uniref:Uncharacterized protein n=1 Tax=Angiostrongylus costaricensis TaxID=334426 RepID=A0A3P7GS52_ANGCS|nr:unnamed protein product [Angiostrongylus costaricensis]
MSVLCGFAAVDFDCSHRYFKVRIYCQGLELPSSPISLNVLSTEESRADSRSFSSASRDDITKVSGENAVQKSDSNSDAGISHKSFTQQRSHSIKQLETQNNSKRQKSLVQLQRKPSPHRKSKTCKKAVLFEASAHQEMTLRSADIGLVSFSGLSEPCSVGSIVEVVVSIL